VIGKPHNCHFPSSGSVSWSDTYMICECPLCVIRLPASEKPTSPLLGYARKSFTP